MSQRESTDGPRPLLSVIVPWWRREEYIHETLESMARQTDQGFECIIVDQGEDGTLRWLDRYRGRFPFRVVLGPEPDWTSKTNRGFEAAQGRYVSMLHTDDVWHPERVEALRRAHRRFPNAGLIVHAARFIDPHSRMLGLWRTPLESDRELSAQEVVRHLFVQNFIACPAPTMRRDLVGSGMDASLWYTGDWDLYLKVASQGTSVYIDRPLADFRLHRASLTIKGSKDSDDFRAQLEFIVQRYSRYLPAEEREFLTALAELSNAINVALAGAFHGDAASLLRVVPAALRAGPTALPRYLQDSRIVERLGARMRLFRSRE